MKSIFALIAFFLLFYQYCVASDPFELRDKGGVFIGSTMSRDPEALGVEVGITQYGYGGLSMYGSLSLLGHQHNDDWMSGFKLGGRWEPTWRIAPFVGLGGFYGYSEISKDADEDGRDNDGDGIIDEIGEEETTFSKDLATFFPEAGIHFWITKTSRFTARYAYNFSSWGRKSDFKLFGLSFVHLWDWE